MYDLCLIGGGIIGASIAYRLSRYNLKILLLEKENDIALGETRANSAIVHAGFDPEEGTLMARFNPQGAVLCRELSEALDVEYIRSGSLVLAFDAAEEVMLQTLLERGRKNGVPGLEIWDREKVRQREPRLNKAVTAALYAPESGVINPWDFALAQVEVAVRNGMDLKLSEVVTSLTQGVDAYEIGTGSGSSYRARRVISCAGTHAAEIRRLLGRESYRIFPTRGEYFLLDRSQDPLISHVIFGCPGPAGKGVLLAPTVHGNWILGPNAEVITDSEGTETTAAGLATVAAGGLKFVPDLRIGSSIRNFAGVRANSSSSDFIIEWAEKGFLDIAGIRSPGLTAAPAIALHVESLLSADGVELVEKAEFETRRKVTRPKHMSFAERAELVAQHPEYGRVICRCEEITEGELLDALQGPVPPRSLDAFKRRCGSGLGRCQGGFCSPKIVEIMERELGIDPLSILQDKVGSEILTGKIQEDGKDV